jgi:hypothetical protein
MQAGDGERRRDGRFPSARVGPPQTRPCREQQEDGLGEEAEGRLRLDTHRDRVDRRPGADDRRQKAQDDNHADLSWREQAEPEDGVEHHFVVQRPSRPEDRPHGSRAVRVGYEEEGLREPAGGEQERPVPDPRDDQECRQPGHDPVERHDADQPLAPEAQGAGGRPELVVRGEGHDEAGDDEEYADALIAQGPGDRHDRLRPRAAADDERQGVIGHHEQRRDGP